MHNNQDGIHVSVLFLKMENSILNSVTSQEMKAKRFY